MAWGRAWATQSACNQHAISMQSAHLLAPREPRRLGQQPQVERRAVGPEADPRGVGLERERGEGVRIIATGNLLPDQARMAFQCGFSEIHLTDALVERHGELAWRTATTTAPDALYTKSGKAPSRSEGEIATK